MNSEFNPENQSKSDADNVPVETDGEAEAAPEEVKPDFDLHISADSLAAYLRIKNAIQVKKITYEEICEYLKEKGVVFGLCDAAIRSFCESGKFFSELLCAKGVERKDGVDGWVDYSFNTEKGLRPKERDDGTVDFRDLGLVKNVEKGAVLCQITPPVEGKDGINVLNQPIPYKPGKMPVLPSGTNTVTSEDQLTLFSEVDGCVEMHGTRIDVNDVFMVRGNVDNALGNVDAIGSIIVQGDVMEGFIVKAGKDISVRGMVEGATLEAQGSISISNGMNGMGRGLLKAGGNIVGKYFENATIQCEGDVYADVILNSRVRAAGSIIIKGSKATLIGGSYQAGKRIFAKTIGTSSNTTTQVSIVASELDNILSMERGGAGKDEELKVKLQELKNALKKLQDSIANLTGQLAVGDAKTKANSNVMLKAAIFKKGQIAQAIESIETEFKQEEEQKSTLSDFRIVVTGITYPGTKMAIGPYNINILNENSNTKFYADKENIVFAPILPSDII